MNKLTQLFMTLASMMLAAYSIAAGTVTETPGDYVLRNADNTPIVGLVNFRFATYAECKAASSVLKTGRYKCDHSTGLNVVQSCLNEPAPRIYLPLVDLQDGSGTKGYELPEMEPPTLKAGSDSEYMPERDWLYVRNPKGDAAYPNCWIRGWEDPTLWRVNPKAEPGKVFMELITPDMKAEDVEMPGVMEPVPMQGDTLTRWLEPESEAARHAMDICYSDTDQTPCPPPPPPFKSACGPIDSAACIGPSA